MLKMDPRVQIDVGAARLQSGAPDYRQENSNPTHARPIHADLLAVLPTARDPGIEISFQYRAKDNVVAQ